MKEKLRMYVEEMFEDAPKNDNADELKEELIGNICEKYDDYVSQGRSEEDAYLLSINSLGDVKQLIKEITPQDSIHRTDIKKYAFYKALAIALYIASPVFIITLGAFGQPVWGLVFMFVCVAGATALEIYSRTVFPDGAANHKKTKKMSDDDVIMQRHENGKTQQQCKKDSSLTAVLWLCVTAVYLLISFITGAWHISWIIFIIGAVVDKIIHVARSK